MPIIEVDYMNVSLEDSVEELDEKLKALTSQLDHLLRINNTLYSWRPDSNKKTFEEYELIEERIDKIYYSLKKSKELLKQGRLLKLYKEQKETQKINELRIARNTLAHYGISTTE
jgi:hypothetical protein